MFPARALAFDTSTDVATIAASRDGAIVAEIERSASNAHGESLFVHLDAMRASLGWTADAIDGIVVGIGPGSFTGTRVGVAAAKGIAMATGAEVVGVTSFDAVLWGVALEDGERAIAVLDAGKGEIYAGGGGIAPIHARTAAAVAEVARGASGTRLVLVGGAATAVAALLDPSRVRVVSGRERPRAADLFEIAWGAARGETSDADALEPFYVRPPEITTPHGA